MSLLNLSFNDRIEPLIVTIVNILARGSHLLFFIVIGNKYGASGITDAVIFLLTPLLVITAVATGAAEAVIMPSFHKVDNADTAKYLFVYSTKKVIKYILPSSLIVIGICSVITRQWNLFLVLILLPVPLIGSFSSLKVGILNASNRFRIAILGPLFGGLTAVLFLAFAPINMYCFALSFLLFELGKLGGIWFFKDITSGGQPLRSILADSIAKRGAGNARLQIIGSFILALVYPVDVWFASTLEIGSITFVEYANKLWNIIPLFFVGHIAIIYSSLSKKEAGYLDTPTSLKVHKLALKYGVLGGLASLLVIGFSNFIVSCLYSFGQMDNSQQIMLANLLKSYLLGAGPYVGALVYVRALSVLGRIDFLLVVACQGLFCNIVCDYIFVKIFGLNGIGFATSIVCFCSYLALSYLYGKISK
jgi:putative peptidoglycan lipid II flippase